MEVVGFYPTSQRIDLVCGHELNELSRGQTAAVGSRLRQVILLAARCRHPYCGLSAVNHREFEGGPVRSPPPPPTILFPNNNVFRLAFPSPVHRRGVLGTNSLRST